MIDDHLYVLMSHQNEIQLHKFDLSQNGCLLWINRQIVTDQDHGQAHLRLVIDSHETCYLLHVFVDSQMKVTQIDSDGITYWSNLYEGTQLVTDNGLAIIKTKQGEQGEPDVIQINFYNHVGKYTSTTSYQTEGEFLLGFYDNDTSLVICTQIEKTLYLVKYHSRCEQNPVLMTGLDGSIYYSFVIDKHESSRLQAGPPSVGHWSNRFTWTGFMGSL